ncbi:YlmC/YmxH family sporulation protein [Desulfofalx alkaliphila]|uniref:YlmC/YmxH family sporulation protein n=1 Tax=Desulfofalx alkaliphila TaxID=105483 RepID=UPI0005590885|nr:YlmC/YmxH family sporulation protein [Desulfofalx alkaliphila]
MLHKATQLAKQDIINITDGAKMGAVIDMHFDNKTGRITAIVVEPSRKIGLFRSGRELVIPWERIVKFGLDTVLVEIDSLGR